MDTIRTAEEAGVLTVTLARAEARNAMDPRMISELESVFRACRAREDLRAVCVEGEGKAFCAGADLGYMKEAASWGRERNLADAHALLGLFASARDVPCLTVGKVHGAALGGGGGLVACLDAAIATTDCRFGFTEVRLGIVPAVISPFVIEKIGAVHARRYFQTGEIFDGERAERIGLVSEAVPAAELDAAVARVLEAACSVAPRASRAAKALVERVAPERPEDVRHHCAELIAELRAGAEAQEGMSAFLAKRAPRWPGTGGARRSDTSPEAGS